MTSTEVGTDVVTNSEEVTEAETDAGLGIQK